MRAERRMLRFAVGTNAFTRAPLELGIRRAATLGFAGVEILADVPHAFPLPLPHERMHALRNALGETGLLVSNVNANTASGFFQDPPPEPVFEPSLASPRGEHRAWRVRFTKHAIDLAAAVGAPSVSVTTGRALAKPERARALLLESLREVVAHAEARNVRVGVEYEPGLLVENAPELLALLETVDSPWLGANVDVAHALVNGEDPVEVIHAVGPRMVHAHLADVSGVKHYHLPPGEGDVSWPRVLDAVRSVGYEGFLTLELYTAADAPDAPLDAGLKHLESTARVIEETGVTP